VVLRNEAGRILATAPLPQSGRGNSRIWATAIYADPADGSAWALLGHGGRLLHIGRDGALLKDLKLVETTETYALHLTADFDRRTIWFTRLGPGRVTQLVRLNLNDPALLEQVVASGVPSPLHMVPDLKGGAWMVAGNRALRMDGNGLLLSTIPLDK
jgi:hypothetical protein